MSTCDKPDSDNRTTAAADSKDKLRNHIRRVLLCIKTQSDAKKSAP